MVKKIFIYSVIVGGVLLVAGAGVLFYLFTQFNAAVSEFDTTTLTEAAAELTADMKTVSTTREDISLTEGQQAVIETLGIEPEVLPGLLTPEVEACAIELFGEQRVEEIKSGDTPSPLEVARASRCVL